MAWSGGSTILLCLGLVLVACSFCSCSPLTRLKALDTLKYKSTFSHGEAGGGVLHGRLVIGPSSQENVKGMRISEEMNIDADFQADMGWAEPRQALVKGEGSSSLRSDNEAVERLLKLQPKVECTGDSMRLRIQDGDSTPGSLFFVDRGGMQSPLPLTKLPQSCGYTIRSTRRDFVLAAPYDGCFVAHEEDCYTLPLRWCGVPVKMSCPLMQPSTPNPPMVTCHAEGMVVKTEWKVSVAKMKVYLSGKWEPLKMAAAKCGFSVVAHPEGVVISVRYAPCLEKKDDLYTLELAGEGETKISCPSLSTTPESTQSPPKNPGIPSKGGPDPNTQPSDTSGSSSTSPESGGHQIPVFPQNPEVPNQGTKETGQPQNPWFYHFPYAYPSGRPVTTAQPLTFPLTKTTNLPTIPPVPKGETPGKSPGGQIPYHFPYHYFNPQNFIPGQKPQLPPAVQPTNGNGQQIYYPFPWTQQPPKSENPATQPPVTQPPPVVTNPPPAVTQPPPVVTNPPPAVTQPPPVVTNPPPAVPPQVLPKGETPEKSPGGQIPYPFPYHYFNPQNLIPGQMPQLPPVGQPTKGQGQQIYYPFPWTQQPPKSENPATQPPVTRPPPVVTNPTPAVTQPPPVVTNPPPAVPPQVLPKGETPGESQVQPPYYFPYHYFNPQNFIPGQKPQLPTAPPVVQPTQGQQIYYPFPWTQQPPKSENPATQPPVTEPPPPPVTNPPSGPTLPPAPPANPQEPHVPPKAPVSQGQMPQFYQYPFMHPWFQAPYQPQMPPTQQPATPAPTGKVKQPSNPEPKIPATPSKAPQQPQAPGQFYQYLYPHTAEGPNPQQQPSQPEAPAGQIPLQFEPYFYYKPTPGQPPVEKPQYETSPPQIPEGPGAEMLQKTPAAQPGKGNGGNVPAGQQPGSPHRAPFYCPQVCPPGLSNCCPQIAFHQHLHHFIPPGHGSKNYGPLQQFLHSGLGISPTDPPQEPTVTDMPETTTAETTLAPSLPPGGIDAMPVLGKPPKQWPTYPYIASYPYAIHNLPQSQSSAGIGEVNPIGPYYIQHPGPQMSQPLAPQKLTKRQMQPSAKLKQLVHVKSSDVRTHPPAEYVDRFPAPQLRDQDARVTNPSQPFVRVSEKLPNNDQNIQPRAGSKGFVLLPDGRSGWAHNTNDKNLDPEMFFQSQSLWPPFQHSNPPQDKPSGTSANEPQFGAPLNPEFLQSLKNMWNPSVPLDSDGFPPHVAEKEFPVWDRATSTRWTESMEPEVSEAEHNFPE